MRTGKCSRKTAETDIYVKLALDCGDNRRINTGVGFFDHMLDLACRHGFMDAEIKCDGDTYVDAHHTVEDAGLAFGAALAEALGDKKGIRRFGSCILPMDEALAQVAVDLSGRPYLAYNADIPSGAFVGAMDAQLAEEFFRAVTVASGMTLHINVLYGRNIHHMLEAVFKGFGRALADAAAPDPRVKGVPSTKGTL